MTVKNKTEVKTLDDLLGEVTEKKAAETAKAIEMNYATRAKFEQDNGGSENIQKTLSKLIKTMTSPGYGKMFLALGIDPNFMNRQLTASKRYNVYAADKLADLTYGLISGHFKNAVNANVLRGLFKARAAGVPFTGKAAQACASDKIVVDKQLKDALSGCRHTMSASTAPTQSSSTMNALETMGIVHNKGTQKFPIYELTDKPVVAKLETIFG